MATREEIIRATAELLAASETGDVSTREICERAGIQAPTLYRQFGDKDRLIATVVDEAFSRHLDPKRVPAPDADPVQVVRDDWDAHTAWALEHPVFYRLIFSPLVSGSRAASDAHAFLQRDLERAAAVGLLTVSASVAAQMILSANVGACLMIINRGAEFDDPSLSGRLRDAIHAQVFGDAVFTMPAGANAARAAADTEARLAAVASTLAALLHDNTPAAEDVAPALFAAPTDADDPTARRARTGSITAAGTGTGKILSANERALLLDWLERLSSAAPTAASPHA